VKIESKWITPSSILDLDFTNLLYPEFVSTHPRGTLHHILRFLPLFGNQPKKSLRPRDIPENLRLQRLRRSHATSPQTQQKLQLQRRLFRQLNRIVRIVIQQVRLDRKRIRAKRRPIPNIGNRLKTRSPIVS